MAADKENLTLEFGTVIDKYLYLNQRAARKLLELHLVECDLSVGKNVKITFSGAENTHLPDLLAISDSSAASGIAIVWKIWRISR